MSIIMDETSIDKIVFNGVEVASSTEGYMPPSNYKSILEELNYQDNRDHLLGSVVEIPNSNDDNGKEKWIIIGNNNNTIDLVRAKLMTNEYYNIKVVQDMYYNYYNTSTTNLYYTSQYKDLDEYKDGFSDDIKSKLIGFRNSYNKRDNKIDFLSALSFKFDNKYLPFNDYYGRYTGSRKYDVITREQSIFGIYDYNINYIINNENIDIFDYNNITTIVNTVLGIKISLRGYISSGYYDGTYSEIDSSFIFNMPIIRSHHNGGSNDFYLCNYGELETPGVENNAKSKDWDYATGSYSFMPIIRLSII